MDKKSKKTDQKKEEFPGYPHYPEKDDIYNKETEESLDDEGSIIHPKNKSEKLLGDDLDVPGADLDDADEIIGEEDEENNYYSLGGDDHDDLEEDRS